MTLHSFFSRGLHCGLIQHIIQRRDIAFIFSIDEEEQIGHIFHRTESQLEAESQQNTGTDTSLISLHLVDMHSF